MNWSIRDLNGRELYRLDLAWPRLRVALEYDGVAAHRGREAEDRARRADLEARGRIVLARAAQSDLLLGRLRRAWT